MYVGSGSADIENATLTRNGVHGLFAADDATAAIINSIVYHNATTQLGGPVTATYSDVEGTPIFTGTGNINFDPAFGGNECEPGDLELLFGSPVVDAGDPDPLFNDVCFPPSHGTVRNDMGADGGPLGCGQGM